MNPTAYIQRYCRCTPDAPGSAFDLSLYPEFNGTLKFYIKAELHVGIYPHHLNWRIPIDVPL